MNKYLKKKKPTLPTTNNVYKRYARFYNFLFGSILNPGRAAAVAKLACRPGDRVLEVGIGTGLSLPFYPHDVQVTGIDGSSEMLEYARKYCDQHDLRHVRLYAMDAENMAFADDNFDKVIAMYVVSVVPHPKQLLKEMQRVCAPGGSLVIVNHFHNSSLLIRMVERSLAPLADLIGFHPDFPIKPFLSRASLEIIDTSPVNLFGYWTLLHARNNKIKKQKPAIHGDKIVVPDSHDASAA